MFTSSSHAEDKECILSQFTNPNGTLRVVVATIVFGMEIDAPNVHTVIHWGAPKSIKDYVPESGRCGRDGADSSAILYFSGPDFSRFHPLSDAVKAYCLNSETCRRDKLLEVFDTSGHITKPIPIHWCCDLCADFCECDDCLYMQSDV